MGRKTEIPITPKVLEWAIGESGFAPSELAAAAGVSGAALQDWLSGDSAPGLTELRRIAAALHRQVAVFVLPAPPRTPHADVSFRHPIGAARARALTPDERRFVRRARRMQYAQAWLTVELGRQTPEIGHVSVVDAPDDVAAVCRQRLGVSMDDQLRWRSASAAFDSWRSALEGLGVTVVQFSMGAESCRGFSLWNDHAPLIAVNTALPEEARSFTLFHELGHLLTRTSSACAAAPMAPHAGDPTERWCEAFAAAVLVPSSALSDVRYIDELSALATLSRRLRVSVRAMALRLISLSKANWRLYQEIPPVSDRKQTGGGGGTGRTRTEIREDEFGPRTTAMFVTAVQREIINESQALDYLDISSAAFERLAAAAPPH